MSFVRLTHRDKHGLAFCPNCSGNAKIYGMCLGFGIECSVCRNVGVYDLETKEKAIAAWNKKADEEFACYVWWHLLTTEQKQEVYRNRNFKIMNFE